MSEQLTERGREAVSRLRKAQASALHAGLKAAEAIADAVATGSAPVASNRPAKSASDKTKPTPVPAGTPARAS